MSCSFLCMLGYHLEAGASIDPFFRLWVTIRSPILLLTILFPHSSGFLEKNSYCNTSLSSQNKNPKGGLCNFTGINNTQKTTHKAGNWCWKLPGTSGSCKNSVWGCCELMSMLRKEYHGVLIQILKIVLQTEQELVSAGLRFSAALLPLLFGTNPRSHHKGATCRVWTGDQLLPVLCHCQFGQDIPKHF